MNNLGGQGFDQSEEGMSDNPFMQACNQMFKDYAKDSSSSGQGETDGLGGAGDAGIMNLIKQLTKDLMKDDGTTPNTSTAAPDSQGMEKLMQEF